MEGENETNIKFFKVVILFIESLVIGLCFLFFIGVTKVDALSYNQRYFTSDGTSICTSNDSTSSCTNEDGNYSYSLYRLNFNSTINANNETTLLWKFTHANNFKIPTGISEDTANNLNKVSIPNIYLITSGGSTVEITDMCSGVANVKTTFNSRTNNLKQWAYTISCQYNVSSATTGIMVRVAQSSATISPWINTIGYSQTTFNITNNPSEADQLINAFNNISADIINAIEQKQQEQINNQNNIWQEQIEFFENQYNQYNESQKVCTSININQVNGMGKNNYALGENNNEVYDSGYAISDYIKILEGNYQILRATGNANSYCLYDIEKNLKSCTKYNLSTSIGTINITSNEEQYIRFTIRKTQDTTLTGSGCQNGNQAIDDSLNDINDSINDDSIDISGFSDFNVVGSDGGITSIITAPLSAISGILNNTCSDIVAPIPFTNKNISMPCLTPIYQQHFPTILNIWQIVVTGIIAYWICLNIFHMVHGFTDPNDDKIEVVDL